MDFVYFIIIFCLSETSADYFLYILLLLFGRSWKLTTTSSYEDHYNIIIILYRYCIRLRRLRVNNACKRLLYIYTQRGVIIVDIVECERGKIQQFYIILKALCYYSWDNRKLRNDIIIIFPDRTRDHNFRIRWLKMHVGTPLINTVDR